MGLTTVLLAAMGRKTTVRLPEKSLGLPAESSWYRRELAADGAGPRAVPVYPTMQALGGRA